MRNVDGVNTAFPDHMTASQWSSYVVGHDPYDPSRGQPTPRNRDFDLTNVRVFAKRYREGRDELTVAQLDALEAFRETLDTPDQVLLDTVFGGPR